MNSQILVSQWVTFNIAVEENFRIEQFLGETKIVNAVDDSSAVEWWLLGDGDGAAMVIYGLRVILLRPKC